jgi:dolichyl-phosphate-mannose-protein mannosyltransferase
MIPFAAAGVALYCIGTVKQKLPGRPDAAALLLLVAVAACMAFVGLGSLDAPRSSWRMSRAGEETVGDFGQAVTLERISSWVGLGAGSCAVERSLDGVSWSRAGLIAQPDRFGYLEWRVIPATGTARYLRLVTLEPGLEVGEVGAFGPDRGRLPLVGIAGPREPFDEQGIVVRTPTAQTGMYFDETYFARSAWEQLRGLEPTETTHPPLGRTIISAGIALWGMNPFGWRFTGALAGTLSVALFSLLARRLLGRTSWALLATLLFTFDFLRFAQSRMATVDVFLLLFALAAFWCALEYVRGSHPWPWLLASGIALGAGCACKWSGAYPVLGVAVLAGAAELGRMRAARPGSAASAAFRGFARLFVCLVVVPLAVYAAGWLPWIVGRGATISDIVARHVEMYRYHSTMSETRWYASAWWQWPLDLRPIWLYQGTVDVPAGRVASIVTMGNPAVFWAGTLALPALSALALARRDRIAAWILVAWLSAWLPWAIAARRLMFIYHYLPAAPFMVLGLAHCLGRLVDRFPRFKPAGIAVGAVAVVLFALFVPLLTGISVPRAYAEALRWLRTWIFFA